MIAPIISAPEAPKHTKKKKQTEQNKNKLSPRTGSEPPSHGRGGGYPPQRTRKLRKIATSGKRRWIGRRKFYKKIPRLVFDQVNFEVTGVKKIKFSQNRAIFTESRNYINNYRY